MLRRSLVGLSIFGSLCWSGAGAAAPALSLDPVVTRDAELRPAARGRYRISQADCQADDVFSFVVTATEWEGTVLEVWAGPAGVVCANDVERTGATAQCWPVLTAAAVSPLQGLDVRVQDILAGHRLGPEYGGAGAGDASACAPEDDLDHAVRLHFLVFEAGFLPAGYQAPTFDTGWDLQGPGAPATLTVTPGDATLAVEFTPSASPDTWEHGVFMLPALAVEPCVAEGASAGTLPGGLEPALLLDTPRASADLAGANGAAQAVLVAGFDELENPGPLSAAACGTPVETTDFFETYRAAGGQGGGGCALAVGGAAGAGGAAAWLVAAALVTRAGARSRARPGKRR